MEVQLHTFLTTALDGGEWSASHPSYYTPRERDPGTHWIGGWVGPRAGPEVVAKRIPSLPSLGTEPWSSSPLSSLYTD